MSYDLTKPQPMYSEAVGYGYDVVEAPTAKSVSPFYFSVKVPDGNYRVSVRLGNKKREGETTVRAESRRMIIEKCVTKKGEFRDFSFVINADINKVVKAYGLFVNLNFIFASA